MRHLPNTDDLLPNASRPVSSSTLLEKPSLTNKDSAEYSIGLEEAKGLDACRKWLAAETPSFTAVTVNGEHGFGKTQLMMQARALFEPSCRVLHVRCRAHEQGKRGGLLQKLLAQLCGYDVWPSLQHILPMMASTESTKQDGMQPDAQAALEDDN